MKPPGVYIRPTVNLGMFLQTAFQRHQHKFILILYMEEMARAVSYYLQSTSRKVTSIHLCNKDRAS